MCKCTEYKEHIIQFQCAIIPKITSIKCVFFPSLSYFALLWTPVQVLYRQFIEANPLCELACESFLIW